MRTVLIFSIGFGVITHQVAAQTLGKIDDVILFTYSEEIPVPVEYDLNDVEEIGGNIYVSFRSPKTAHYKFYRVDSDTKLSLVGELPSDNPESKFTTAVIGENTYSAYFVTDRESKFNCLYLQEFKFEEAKLIGEPKQVDCLQGDDFYLDFANSFAAYKVSPDKSKLLIYYKLPELKDKTKKFRFCMYDSNLNLVWKKDVVMSHEGNKLRIGNGEWFMASGFTGNSSNAQAIQLDDKGNVFMWSTPQIEHRGQFQDVLITKIHGDDVETQKISLDGAIVMSNLNMNDFRLKPFSNGVYIFGHVEAIPGDKATKFSNRGLICGVWNDKGLSYQAYPYDYALTMECMNDGHRRKSEGYAKAQRPVGWMPFPPQENGSALKHGDKGIYMVEHGPIGYLFHSVSSEGKLEWSTGLAIPDLPTIIDQGDRVVLYYMENPENLQQGWTPKQGISSFDSENPTIAVATIDATNPSIKLKRKMTLSEKGSVKHPAYQITKLPNGLFYGLSIRIDLLKGMYRRFYRVAFIKSLN